MAEYDLTEATALIVRAGGDRDGDGRRDAGNKLRAAVRAVIRAAPDYTKFAVDERPDMKDQLIVTRGNRMIGRLLIDGEGMGLVSNDHPSADISSRNATGLTNVTLGAMYGTTLASYWRFSGSAGVGLPVGSGGGNNPDPYVAAAMRAAALARAAMDNTMFTVNDIGFPVGVDLAYTRRGFTAQAEVSLISSARVRGEQKSPDKSKVNATSAVFVGYFVLPRRLSLGAELHYQRFLGTTDAVTKDAAARDNLTTSGGVRGYFEVASNVQFRPGVSVGTGISGFIADRRYEMVQVDFPFAF